MPSFWHHYSIWWRNVTFLKILHEIALLYGFYMVTQVCWIQILKTDETKGQSQKHSKPFFSFCLYNVIFLFVSILYENLTDCLTTLSALHMWKMARNRFMHKIYVLCYKTINHAGNKLSKALWICSISVLQICSAFGWKVPMRWLSEV